MKNNRHKLILELVTQRNIETQEELAQLLKEQGLKVTQATVSRDIRELNLTKVSAENGKQKYIVLDNGVSTAGRMNRYARLLNDAILSADTAKNLLILRTSPGLASAVGAAVDALGLTAAVGSLAGDDTVFCAFKEDEDAVTALQELQQKISTGLEVKKTRRRRSAAGAADIEPAE